MLQRASGVSEPILMRISEAGTFSVGGSSLLTSIGDLLGDVIIFMRTSPPSSTCVCCRLLGWGGLQWNLVMGLLASFEEGYQS